MKYLSLFFIPFLLSVFLASCSLSNPTQSLRATNGNYNLTQGNLGTPTPDWSNHKLDQPRLFHDSNNLFYTPSQWLSSHYGTKANPIKIYIDVGIFYRLILLYPDSSSGYSYFPFHNFTVDQLKQMVQHDLQGDATGVYIQFTDNIKDANIVVGISCKIGIDTMVAMAVPIHVEDIYGFKNIDSAKRILDQYKDMGVDNNKQGIIAFNNDSILGEDLDAYAQTIGPQIYTSIRVDMLIFEHILMQKIGNFLGLTDPDNLNGITMSFAKIPSKLHSDLTNPSIMSPRNDLISYWKLVFLTGLIDPQIKARLVHYNENDLSTFKTTLKWGK